jgi:aspartyl/asparaginyl beta-hydroxylase (cupin superfamily)
MEFIKALEIQFPAIKAEYQAVINNGMYVGWPERFLYNEGWNVFGLRFQRSDHPEAHAICPVLSSFIKTHDALLQTVGFSMLNPGTVIHPHVGYTNTVLRCHMGIIVPEGDCCLRVGKDICTWQEGKAFVFDDTIEHEAWNKTNGQRVVLLMDLERSALQG